MNKLLSLLGTCLGIFNCFSILNMSSKPSENTGEGSPLGKDLPPSNVPPDETTSKDKQSDIPISEGDSHERILLYVEDVHFGFGSQYDLRALLIDG